MVTRTFAIEDGNIDRSTIITARTIQYKDIDLTFAKSPTGDVYKKQHAAAVKQAVKNVLLTNNYEKPFQWDFGGNLTGLLFELANEDIEYELENAIRLAVEKYEPRATVQSVTFNNNMDANSVSVTVTFLIRNIEQTEVLDVTLTRLR